MVTTEYGFRVESRKTLDIFLITRAGAGAMPRKSPGGHVSREGLNRASPGQEKHTC